ncbi:transcriptional regulator [Leminorella grimontii]|uniref:Transcriptional regulator n=2 Tax=Leminorella grimontii TaxID=82981 RepID=A0AAV5NAI8_9GAMM|nr:metalloregulator ArsR/SmtB family transcription factor [Leminorella grimontii]KFC93177.1 ArsR family transcriptional regulator [Leminorella grimontii ATCC 33999 = DSM 5078]GKX57662.1 transcriptional regulator [Leminorella grimontii]VFS55796.1 Biofilm growth-associated repressor [Leminorella grimontii]
MPENTSLSYLDAIREAASQVASLMRTLSNEDRLMILCRLSQGALSVSELEEGLDIRQPTLSQQLTVLRNGGAVETRREGKRIYYSVSDARVLTLLDTLYALYCPQPKEEM